MFELLWKGVKEMEKLAYNMKEVAEVLGISKSLAYEMAKKGELPIIRMGNRILVPIKRLEEMFEILSGTLIANIQRMCQKRCDQRQCDGRVQIICR